MYGVNNFHKIQKLCELPTESEMNREKGFCIIKIKTHLNDLVSESDVIYYMLTTSESNFEYSSPLCHVYIGLGSTLSQRNGLNLAYNDIEKHCLTDIVRVYLDPEDGSCIKYPLRDNENGSYVGDEDIFEWHKNNHYKSIYRR